MGFWHTGVMDHLEQHVRDPFNLGRTYPPMVRVYACTKCDQTFEQLRDLESHVFDGHPTSRPLLLLRGRECGRSRLEVREQTDPDDWAFQGTTRVVVNGRAMAEGSAKELLSSSRTGVLTVELAAEHSTQPFELSFRIANPHDLDAIDDHLRDMAEQRSLLLSSLQRFLDATKRFESGRSYRDGIANYLYGVMAREGSPESGLLDRGEDIPPYTAKFDDAVAELAGFARPVAEAICSLVAFHYNQLEVASAKAMSPRVATVSHRLLRLLEGHGPRALDASPAEAPGIDRLLSDTATEHVIGWCSIPLDGTAGDALAQIGAAIPSLEPMDRVKLRLVAAEHHFAAGELEEAAGHARELRHNPLTEAWAERFADRIQEARG